MNLTLIINFIKTILTSTNQPILLLFQNINRLRIISLRIREVYILILNLIISLPGSFIELSKLLAIQLTILFPSPYFSLNISLALHTFHLPTLSLPILILQPILTILLPLINPILSILLHPTILLINQPYFSILSTIIKISTQTILTIFCLLLLLLISRIS